MLDYSNNDAILKRVHDQLRDYQIKCVNKGITNKRILIDMKTGYGKTVCALCILFYHRPQRILFLCSRNSLGAWIGDIRKWFPEYSDPKHFQIIRAQGCTQKKRIKQWNNTDKTFFIATKETFVRDKKYIQHAFEAYDYDEVHRVPKHDTPTFKTLEPALRDIPIKVMQTATWVKRHAGTGWRQLHMLDRKKFPSYWKFVNKFCIMHDNGWGKEIIGPQNTELWKHVIDDYVFRYHEVNNHIPPVIRKAVWVDMDKEQQRIYTELSENMFTMLDNGELLISKLSISNFIKHKQLKVCPKILSESLGYGAAFNMLLTHLKEYKDDLEEQHCVLFSCFRKPIEHWKIALEKAGYKVFVFVGGTDGMEVMRRAEQFRNSRGKKSIALCTIDFAESYHLGSSKRAHVIGMHHDVDPMEQAEGRLTRADSTKDPVTVRYWLYNNTTDRDKLYDLKAYSYHVKQLFKNYDEMRRALGSGSADFD